MTMCSARAARQVPQALPHSHVGMKHTMLAQTSLMELMSVWRELLVKHVPLTVLPCPACFQPLVIASFQTIENTVGHGMRRLRCQR
jgi:hypothetical protein